MRSWTWYARVPLLLGWAALGCGEELGPRIPAAIVIVPNAPRIPAGQTRQLTATVVDAAGREIDDLAVTFESSEPGIVTVDSRGLLTSVGPLGLSTITAASGELTGSVEAEVVLAPSAILVSPTSLELNRGEIAFLSVIVTDENSEPEPTAPVTFTSDNPAVATVDGGGVVQATNQDGAATISIRSGDRSAELPVTVRQIPGTITLTPSNLVLQQGQTSQVTATVLDRAGTPVSGVSLTWSSSNTASATVNASGLVRAVTTGGSAVITATAEEASGEMTVFVGEAPPGTLLATSPVGQAWGVAVTPAGRYLITTLDGKLVSGTLPNFGFTTTTMLAVQATDVAVNQDGTVAYVAAGNDGTTTGIGVVDLGTNIMTDVLPTSMGLPLAVELSLDGSKLFVGSDLGYEIIDLEGGPAQPGAIGGQINAFTRHPSEPLIYATVYGVGVIEISQETGQVTRNFPVVGTPQECVVAPDGSRLYIAEEFANQIKVYDLETGVEAAPFTSAGGFGMALTPDGSQLYVTNLGQVHIVDRASGTLVRSVNVGAGVPRRIAFSTGGIAVVTNESGWVDFIE
jgi:YVTN family beta-propeller protein